MITRVEYLNTPHRLHQPYYLSVAQEAGVRVPEWLMLQVRVSKKLTFPTGVPEKHWADLASKFQAPLADALHQRGTTWSFIAGICAVKAMAQHQMETENENI